MRVPKVKSFEQVAGITLRSPCLGTETFDLYFKENAIRKRSLVLSGLGMPPRISEQVMGKRLAC